MENDPFERDYYYDGDEGVEIECQGQQSEVGFLSLIGLPLKTLFFKMFI